MAKANVQVGEVKVDEKTIEEQTQETIKRSLEIIKKNGSDLEQLRQKVIKTAEDVNSIMSGYVYKGIEKMRGQVGTDTGLNSQIKARKEALKELSYTDNEIKVDNIILSLTEQRSVIADKIKAESQREVLYDLRVKVLKFQQAVLEMQGWSETIAFLIEGDNNEPIIYQLDLSTSQRINKWITLTYNASNNALKMTLNKIPKGHSLQELNRNGEIKNKNESTDDADLAKLKETYTEVVRRFNKSKSLKKKAPYLVFWKENQKYDYMSVSNLGDIAEGYQVFYFKRAVLTAIAEEDRVKQFMQKGVGTVDQSSGLYGSDIELNNGSAYSSKSDGADLFGLPQVKKLIDKVLAEGKSMNGRQMLEMIVKERMTTGKFAEQNKGLRNHMRNKIQDETRKTLDENLKKILADWGLS